MCFIQVNRYILFKKPLLQLLHIFVCPKKVSTMLNKQQKQFFLSTLIKSKEEQKKLVGKILLTGFIIK